MKTVARFFFVASIVLIAAGVSKAQYPEVVSPNINGNTVTIPYGQTSTTVTVFYTYSNYDIVTNTTLVTGISPDGSINRGSEQRPSSLTLTVSKLGQHTVSANMQWNSGANGSTPNYCTFNVVYGPGSQNTSCSRYTVGSAQNYQTTSYLYPGTVVNWNLVVNTFNVSYDGSTYTRGTAYVQKADGTLFDHAMIDILNYGYYQEQDKSTNGSATFSPGGELTTYAIVTVQNGGSGASASAYISW